MRNPNDLKIFALADRLVLDVYHKTSSFPNDEIFGLRSQIRRAAVSIPSNIVEGCSRTTDRDFLRFLEISYGSAMELQYQLSLAFRLHFITPADYASRSEISQETSRCINGFISSLKKICDSRKTDNYQISEPEMSLYHCTTEEKLNPSASFPESRIPEFSPPLNFDILNPDNLRY